MPPDPRAGRRHEIAVRARAFLEGLIPRSSVLEGIEAEDYADPKLRPERHEHELAWCGLQALGQQVVVGLVQRDGHQNGHAWPDRRGRSRRRHVIHVTEETFQTHRPTARTRISRKRYASRHGRLKA